MQYWPSSSRQTGKGRKRVLTPLSCNARGVTNALITPHDCWLALGENNTQRALAYLALVNQRMAQGDLDHIRNSLKTGLPTGNHRFRREIESALAIRLGHGKRGRPRKAAD